MANKIGVFQPAQQPIVAAPQVKRQPNSNPFSNIFSNPGSQDAGFAMRRNQPIPGGFFHSVGDKTGVAGSRLYVTA